MEILITEVLSNYKHDTFGEVNVVTVTRKQALRFLNPVLSRMVMRSNVKLWVWHIPSEYINRIESTGRDRRISTYEARLYVNLGEVIADTCEEVRGGEVVLVTGNWYDDRKK